MIKSDNPVGLPSDFTYRHQDLSEGQIHPERNCYSKADCVVQSGQHLAGMHEALSSIPSTGVGGIDITAHTFNLTTLGQEPRGLEVQGHPWLSSKFEANTE